MVIFFGGVRLFGHQVLILPHSFSYGKDSRESKSNVPGPYPGMERLLFVTGGSPEPPFILHKILETRLRAVVVRYILIDNGSNMCMWKLRQNY